MNTFSFGDQQQNTQQTPFGGFSFGSTTSTASATQPTIGTNPLGSTAPFGGGILGGTAASTTTTSLFGATQTAPSFSSSLFPTATTTSSAFPTLGQTSVSSSAPGGFSFGGFGNTATSSSLSFGQPLSSVSTAPSTLTTPSVGLGGVDIQTATGLNGASTSQKKDGKAVKEAQIPNEISVTVESFKKYVKEQKAIREEMSRVSSKNIFRVQEQVVALRQQLSVVSNGLQRNAIAIAKLKEESNQELKNAEIAQRTKDSPSSLQYENNAPTEYFHNLANSFEKQMQSYRQQIEQLERHLLSLSQPYTLTPNEWTAIRRRLHDVFVTLAAQLQTIHQEVQVYKEHFINNQRLNHGDIRNLLQNRKDSLRDNTANTQLLSSVTYGPSPFAAVQSAVGKAITNVFGRSQQLPGGSTTLGNLGSSGFDSGLSGGLLTSLNANRGSFFSSTTFKPLGK